MGKGEFFWGDGALREKRKKRGEQRGHEGVPEKQNGCKPGLG